MATTIPPLTWPCPQCGQQVPAGQANCPVCAGAGAPPPPVPPAPRSPQPRSAPAGGPTRNKKRIIIGAVSILALCLILLLVARGCSSTKPATPKPKPAAVSPQVTTTPPAPITAAPTKPSPMPPPTSPKSKPTAPILRPRPTAKVPAQIITASSQELIGELRQIRRLLEERRRQPAATPPPAIQPQPRREWLSDRELERRYKERLLLQEP